MRRFRDIRAPSTQSLWLNNGELKVYGAKGWTSLNDTSEDRQELEEKAHDNDAYYDIAADGSITKNDSYISPNEPYTVNLTSEQVDVALDDVTASKVNKCGEITITGSTGPITYTRTSDSTSAAIYFISDRKDGKVTLLTYIVSTKTISPAVVNLPLPATTTQIGAVKKVSAIEDLVTDSATAESVAYKVNDILAALRTAGILTS